MSSRLAKELILTMLASILGARLSSHRTVEWHLRNVFTKLDITSRRELRHALPDAAREALQP